MKTEYRYLGAGWDGVEIALRIQIGKRARLEDIHLDTKTALALAGQLISMVIANQRNSR